MKQVPLSATLPAKLPTSVGLSPEEKSAIENLKLPVKQKLLLEFLVSLARNELSNDWSAFDPETHFERFYESITDKPMKDPGDAGLALIKHLRASLQDRSTRRLPASADQLVFTLASEREKWKPTVTERRDLAQAFWRPHDSGQPTYLVYGRPLFEHTTTDCVGDDGERYQQDVFTRRYDENSEVDLRRNGRDGRPAARYVAAGEVAAALRLTDYLARMDVRIEPFAGRHDSTRREVMGAAGGEETDCIVLGSVRSNGLIAEYQDYGIRLPSNGRRLRPLFQLRSHHVYRWNREDREYKAAFSDDEGRRGQEDIPVLVTRMAGLEGGTVTIIASNHGAGIAAVSKTLTDSKRFEQALASVQVEVGEVAQCSAGARNQLETHGKVADVFQLLFKVRVSDTSEDNADAPNCEHAWVPDPLA